MTQNDNIYLVRKTLMMWGDKKYFNGGYGEINSIFNSYDDALRLVDQLTIDVFRQDPHICRNLDCFDSGNYSISNFPLLQSYFKKEYGINEYDALILPDNISDTALLKLSKIFQTPFVSIIEKKDTNFYINFLNKDFWGEGNFAKWINKDFTCWEFEKKVVYHSVDDARKDGFKRMLLYMKYYRHYHDFLSTNLPDNMKDLLFNLIQEVKYGEDNFYSELPNNFFSTEFNRLYDILNDFLKVINPVVTIEVPFEVATFYNFQYLTTEQGYLFNSSYKPHITSTEYNGHFYVKSTDKPQIY